MSEVMRCVFSPLTSSREQSTFSIYANLVLDLVSCLLYLVSIYIYALLYAILCFHSSMRHIPSLFVTFIQLF